MAGSLLAVLFLVVRTQERFQAWKKCQYSIATSDLFSIKTLIQQTTSSTKGADGAGTQLDPEVENAINELKKGELNWGTGIRVDGTIAENAANSTWSSEPNRYQRLRITASLDARFAPRDQLTLIRRFSNEEIDRLHVFDWLCGAVILISCSSLGGGISIRRARRQTLLRSLSVWSARNRQRPSTSVGSRDEAADILHSVDSDIARIVSGSTESLIAKMEAIQQSAEHSTLVLSAMPVGVLAFDAELRLLFVNRAGRELLGLADSQFRQPLIEVLRQPVVVDLIQQVSQEPQVQEVELELPLSKMTLRLRAHPLADSNPTTVPIVRSGVLLTVSDETRLKQLENARRDFTANVSHELKTPLSAIKAYAETLLIGALEDEDASRLFVERISEQANRLDLLIKDLLHLTKLQSQPDKPALIVLELNDVLKTCVEEHRTIGQARKITIDVSKVEKNCRVLADLESLRTIIGNLLGNAVRYNRPEGWVKVSTRTTETSVILTIADNGIGIPPEDLDRIFERFYRVEKARSQDAGGTGLGLSIVKHLAQAILAEIHVRSELGIGSAFELHLKRHVSKP